jgi:menaquinol-cytochrome c reductase iron-sulfur subunit
MVRDRKNKEVTRRKFLSYSIKAIGGFIAAAVATPLIGYFISPALKGRQVEGATNVGAVDQFQVNKPQLVRYMVRRRDGWIAREEKQAAWVVKYEDGSLVVFDPHCTHLGCAYSWMEKGWWKESPYKGEPHFHCPCHEGIFAIDGTVISGPPPRPLDRLHHKIEDGQLYILGCGKHYSDEPEVSTA